MMYSVTEKKDVSDELQEGKEEKKTHEKVMIEVHDYFLRECACRKAMIEILFSFILTNLTFLREAKKLLLF